MRILYLSCHAVLEYDELRLFEQLGYDCFSIGSYLNPREPRNPIRPPLNHGFHPRLASLSEAEGQKHLAAEAIGWADVVIVMHIPEWVESNWQKLQHKRVIWRSIGQSHEPTERRLEPYRRAGLEVVRFSPAERRIPGYLGEDAVIRFYKDPSEYGGWTGDERRVMTHAIAMGRRRAFCRYDVFHEVAQGLPVDLYGAGNGGCPESAGELAYEDLKAALRRHRVFLYTGSRPASYTLAFIEAMMTGIPIVSIGRVLGNLPHLETFEVSEIIENGVNGFCSDSPAELRERLILLLNDRQAAEAVSTAGRRTAVDLFGMATITRQWRDFLEGGGAGGAGARP